MEHRSMPEIEEDVIENDDLFKVIRNSSNSVPLSKFRDCQIRIVQPHDRPQENTSSYTPKIISIGPLHHGKPELQPMENLKHKYLNDFLNRRKRDGMIPNPLSDGRNELLRRFIKAASEMEERVRSWYELSNTISSNDFVKMLVIDGCFLLEFLIRRSSPPFVEDLGWQLPLINFDILLFENQIPFFVLDEFYKIQKEFRNYTDTMMKNIAYDYLYLKDNPFIKTYDYNFSQISDSALNLLHLYHMMMFNMERQQPSIDLIRSWIMAFFSWFFVIISYPMFLIHQLLFAKPLYPTMPTSAMELEEAGVRFQGSGMDLRFDKGTFFIPVLSFNNKKLSLLKNLLAFEFYFDVVPPCVRIYVAFLFLLIKNPEDLKVMEKNHIIITSSRGEESFRLVSNLLESGFEDLETFENHFTSHSLWKVGWLPPAKIKAALKDYCKKPHHRWRAKLMKDYFGNPWSILGIFVGVLLLVLTTLQTVFTVLSYYKPQVGG